MNRRSFFQNTFGTLGAILKVRLGRRAESAAKSLGAPLAGPGQAQGAGHGDSFRLARCSVIR